MPSDPRITSGRTEMVTIEIPRSLKDALFELAHDPQRQSPADIIQRLVACYKATVDTTKVLTFKSDEQRQRDLEAIAEQLRLKGNTR
jgi:hypothetical protein